MGALQIRRATPAEFHDLLRLWEQSVRASHDFLSDEDLEFLRPLVRDQALPALELWVLTEDPAGVLRGFMGLDGNRVEALFVAPEHFRQGNGRRLVAHARGLKGPLWVDVNEQNPGARLFYERLGFVVVGRSPLDGTGRPFPLLHLQDAGCRPRSPQETSSTGGPGSRLPRASTHDEAPGEIAADGEVAT